MTILYILIAVFLILTIGWAVYTWFPSTPAPMNFMKWVIYIILVLCLFGILFNVLGWADFGNVLNRKV